VDRCGGDAIAIQQLGELVGAVLRAREDEGLVDDARPHEMGQQLALALAVDRMHDLVDQFHGGVLRRGLD
jgi:hypothetical protein